MTRTASTLMTVEEFFVWQQSQEDRYELVEGVPVIMRRPHHHDDRGQLPA